VSCFYFAIINLRAGSLGSIVLADWQTLNYFCWCAGTQQSINLSINLIFHLYEFFVYMYSINWTYLIASLFFLVDLLYCYLLSLKAMVPIGYCFVINCLCLPPCGTLYLLTLITYSFFSHLKAKWRWLSSLTTALHFLTWVTVFLSSE